MCVFKSVTHKKKPKRKERANKMKRSEENFYTTMLFIWSNRNIYTVLCAKVILFGSNFAVCLCRLPMRCVTLICQLHIPNANIKCFSRPSPISLIVRREHKQTNHLYTIIFKTKLRAK